MPTWRDVWEMALYGPGGFYRRQSPVDHFRTSVHASPLFAEAILTLVRQHVLDTVVDVGAGDGELLAQLHERAPDLHLLGVELRGRPTGLDPHIQWQNRLPKSMTGLVLANELLDNIPCTVVELDAQGSLRVVDVGRDSTESLGAIAPAEVVAWCQTWWPLTAAGDRAEIGLEREEFWAGVCGRTSGGICLAVDYGHVRDARPYGGTLASYRNGRLVSVALDGTCDITAHVAIDALAARVGGELATQRAALAELGVSEHRPDADLAAADPRGYLQALAGSGAAAELTASPGLGDFWWLLTPQP